MESNLAVFGHVLDIVEGLEKAIDTPSCYGQVINLGSSEEVTVKDLAKKIIETLGSESEVRYLSYDEVYGEGFEDMQRRVPNIEKSRNA